MKTKQELKQIINQESLIMLNKSKKWMSKINVLLLLFPLFFAGCSNMNNEADISSAMVVSYDDAIGSERNFWELGLEKINISPSSLGLRLDPKLTWKKTLKDKENGCYYLIFLENGVDDNYFAVKYSIKTNKIVYKFLIKSW